MWIAEIVEKCYRGREAIYNSVAPTHNLPPSGASTIGGRRARNYEWLPYRALLLVPDAYPHQFFKPHYRALAACPIDGEGVLGAMTRVNNEKE
jgi:hypothetical protein